MVKSIKIRFMFVLSVALCCCLLAGLQPFKASASKFVGVIMEENFTTEEFSTDNWRLAEPEDGESSVYVSPSEPYLLLMGPTYDSGTAVYIDAPAEVTPDTGKLIVEFDLIGESAHNSMFSVVTGIGKAESGAADFTTERRSQMIMCGAGGNAFTVQAYGLPEFAGQPATFNIYNNGTNYGGASTVGGYGVKGNRYRLVYGQDGSFYSYASPILDDGTYGAEVAGCYVTDGMIENGHSGCVGFFFWFETAGISLRNVKISTQSAEGAPSLTVFEDAQENDSLKSEWKTVNGNTRVSMSRTPGSAVFDNPSDENYLVSAGSKNIEYDAMYDAYITMEFSLTFRELNGARKFGLAFGLNTSEDNTQTEGVAYLHFNRNAQNGQLIDLSWTLKGADQDLTSNVVTLNASDVIGKTLDIVISPYVNGKADVKIGDTTYTFIVEGEKIILSKRLAFIAHGGDPEGGDTVVAELGPVTITNRYDSVPDDIVDLSQGFDGVDENGNPWYDRDLYSFGGGLGYTYGDLNAGVFMEDGQLVFRNAGHNSYFSPLKAFGDFLMQFDITDIAREDEYSQDGTLYRPFMRSWLGIAFGLPSAGSPYTSGYLFYITSPYEEDAENPGKYKASEAPSTYTIINASGAGIVSGTLRHNFIDPDLDGKTIVVRLKADGGILSFSYYVKGEESMEMLDEPLFEYDNNGLGFGHNGYFGITCTSAGEQPVAGDFSIDNFVLRSLDRNVNITNDPDKPVEEAPPVQEEPEKEEPAGSEGGCSSSVFGKAMPFAAVLAVACGAVLCLAKRNKTVKNKKE